MPPRAPYHVILFIETHEITKTIEDYYSVCELAIRGTWKGERDKWRVRTGNGKRGAHPAFVKSFVNKTQNKTARTNAKRRDITKTIAWLCRQYMCHYFFPIFVSVIFVIVSESTSVHLDFLKLCPTMSRIKASKEFVFEVYGKKKSAKN